MTRRSREAVQVGLVLLVVGVLLAVALPRAVGTSLSAAVAAARPLGLLDVVGLLVLWLVGLWAHTWVMTAALPRLGHGQALALNLSGSAAANLLPFGGPLGVGIGWAMARSWGFAAAPFGAFTVVVNLANILVKLALPVAGAAVLVLSGTRLPEGLLGGAVTAGVVCAAAVGLVAAGLRSRRSAERLGGGLERLVRALLRLLGRGASFSCRQEVVDARTSVLEVLARGWHRMLLGMTAYVVLQAALLFAVLQLLGADLSPGVVFAGFAVGRLLSLAPLTPGGVGIAETGTAAVLVALGGAPAVVTAAALVYAGLTYALEIPVGGAVTGLWWWGLRPRVGAS